MNNIRIKFVDFWFGFSEKNNYFTKLLSHNYTLEFSDNPEILIYSCFGREHLKYNCIRIFYSAENVRPNFNGCDYAITSDYNDNPRHYRFPLYGLYLEGEKSMSQFINGYTKEEARRIWRSKSKFCCMVVSNGASKERLSLYEKLSEYKKVDSGGKILNNVGGPVKDKLEFIKDYRFVISFENSSYPGYTTEKIIEPIVADCIPLYWGDPFINKEINKDCFLEKSESKSLETFIKEIIETDQEEEKAVSLLMAGKFVGNRIPDSIDKERLIAFFDKIICTIKSELQRAKTWKGKWYFISVKASYYLDRVKGLGKSAKRVVLMMFK